MKYTVARLTYCRMRDRDLFHQALEVPAAARDAFLVAACPDETLRARVRALLAAHAAAEGGFLETPATELHAAAMGRAGRRLGAYEILRELGRGGMGAVYLARRADREFEKAVAIKIVAAPLGDDELVRRFRRERQILAGLDHPYIARLLDGGTTEDGLPYLVMEHVDGLPIDEYVRSHKLPVRRVLELFRNVCEAVQFAHGHLVVHRDIKPQNILVMPDGTPRLLDFGIATLVDVSGDGSARLTRTGVSAMTPEYASPEQLRGSRVTTASDVYSLGVLLYRLLTGTLPHDVSTKTPDEVYRLIVDTDPTPAEYHCAARGRSGASEGTRGRSGRHRDDGAQEGSGAAIRLRCHACR